MRSSDITEMLEYPIGGVHEFRPIKKIIVQYFHPWIMYQRCTVAKKKLRPGLEVGKIGSGLGH